MAPEKNFFSFRLDAEELAAELTRKLNTQLSEELFPILEKIADYLERYPDPDRLVSLEDAASILGSSRQLVEKLCAQGELHIIDISPPESARATNRIKIIELREFIKRRESKFKK